MNTDLLLLAGAGLFLAGIVKGATGLGYSSCALPFLVAAIGLEPAMVLVLAPAMATNVGVAFSAGHFLETVRRFAGLYLAMLPGIAAGIVLLLWVPQRAAVATLGAVIVCYALVALVRPPLALSARSARALQLPTGFMNGVLTGLTGSQVMPLFPYMMSLGLDPGRLVQAINIAVMLASVVLAGGLLAAGIMTPGLIAGSVAAILPALAGVAIGNSVRARIPAASFKIVVLVVLLLTGLLLLAR